MIEYCSWYGSGSKRGSWAEKRAHMKSWEWYLYREHYSSWMTLQRLHHFPRTHTSDSMPLDFLCVLNGVRKMETFAFKMSGDLNDFLKKAILSDFEKALHNWKLVSFRKWHHRHSGTYNALSHWCQWLFFLQGRNNKIFSK